MFAKKRRPSTPTADRERDQKKREQARRFPNKQGAVPAAILALLVQGLFDVSERVLVPRGLRLDPVD